MTDSQSGRHRLRYQRRRSPSKRADWPHSLRKGPTGGGGGGMWAAAYVNVMIRLDLLQSNPAGGQLPLLRHFRHRCSPGVCPSYREWGGGDLNPVTCETKTSSERCTDGGHGCSFRLYRPPPFSIFFWRGSHPSRSSKQTTVRRKTPGRKEGLL